MAGLTQMRVLITSATDAEMAPVVATLGRSEAGESRITHYRYRAHRIDVLTTGVGMAATAAWTARRLAQEPYDAAFNFGVCGSFDQAIEPGTTVHVVSDCFAELGVEDGESFITAQAIGLVGHDDEPFTEGRLVNDAPPANLALSALPRVSGITVNTV